MWARRRSARIVNVTCYQGHLRKEVVEDWQSVTHGVIEVEIVAPVAGAAAQTMFPKNLRYPRVRFPALHPAANPRRHCCDTMESLPTELIEIICSYLVQQPSRDEMRIPLSTAKERRNV